MIRAILDSIHKYVMRSLQIAFSFFLFSWRICLNSQILLRFFKRFRNLVLWNCKHKFSIHHYIFHRLRIHFLNEVHRNKESTIWNKMQFEYRVGISVCIEILWCILCSWYIQLTESILQCNYLKEFLFYNYKNDYILIS